MGMCEICYVLIEHKQESGIYFTISHINLMKTILCLGDVYQLNLITGIHISISQLHFLIGLPTPRSSVLLCLCHFQISPVQH